MSQFVFTMTYRMVAIATACLVLLAILLFVLGVQIGKLMVAPVVTPAPVAGAASYANPAGAAPAAPVAGAAPAPLSNP